jgi:hypothetical protein
VVDRGKTGEEECSRRKPIGEGLSRGAGLRFAWRVEHMRGSDWRTGAGTARQTNRQRGLVGAPSSSRRGHQELHSAVQGSGGRSRVLGAATRLGQRIP